MLRVSLFRGFYLKESKIKEKKGGRVRRKKEKRKKGWKGSRKGGREEDGNAFLNTCLVFGI